MVRFGVANKLCALSGGNWNNGSNAGVCALNLNNARTNANNNNGFRCDCAPSSCSKLRSWSTGIGYPGRKAELCKPSHSGSGRERLRGIQ